MSAPTDVAVPENEAVAVTVAGAAGKRFAVAQLDEITPVPCPCGQARRAFKEPWNTLASVHLTDISVDSKLHYHKKMTEVYIVLEGEGYLEADGERIPLKPMTSIMIRPGCVHRAVGNLRIINVPMPPFDPADEFEVGEK